MFARGNRTGAGGIDTVSRAAGGLERPAAEKRKSLSVESEMKILLEVKKGTGAYRGRGPKPNPGPEGQGKERRTHEFKSSS